MKAHVIVVLSIIGAVLAMLVSTSLMLFKCLKQRKTTGRLVWVQVSLLIISYALTFVTSILIFNLP